MPPLQSLTFRSATIDEAERIARLVNAAYRPAPGEGGWTHESGLVHGSRISPRQVEALIITSRVIVGLADGTIVACVHVASDGNEAHIGMLAVEPSLQAGGIGKALLRHAEEYASTLLGAEYLVLVVVGARRELMAFYLRRGYERTGNVLEYPVEAGVGTPLSGTLELEVLRKRSRERPQASHP